MNNTGFINGYRWGVEYPTNGSKPDLPDDVIIQLSVPMCRGALSVFASPEMCAAKGATFKITDERYKPEDTSYLGAPTFEDVSKVAKGRIVNSPEALTQFDNDLAEYIKSKAESGWYCYETQKSLRLPPVGEYCQVYINGWYNCYIVGLDDLGGCVFRKDGEYMQRITDDSFRPLDWNHKAEAERKRVVDAAFASLTEFNKAHQVLQELYDAGFLRMPEDK